MALAGVFAASIASIGCGGSGGGSGTMGTLALRLADAPDPSTSAVDVTIDRVEANIDGTWTPITGSTPAYSGNIMTLATTDTLLGTTSLPTGHYTQVRLFISQASVTDSSGTHNLTIPSGAQTGLKVLVDYDINASDVTTLLLDFDVAHSITKQGNGSYSLKPVVRGSVQVLSGTVTGSVSDANGPVQGAVVTLTPDGATPSDTDPGTLTLADGTFKFWGVMPGTYTVNVTYTDPNTSTTEVGSVSGEVVTAQANTDAGAITIAAGP